MTLFDHPEIASPAELQTEHFVLRPLEPAAAALDYAAYVASPETIRIHSCGRWPMEGFTLDEESELLRQHDERHRAHKDFAFVLLNSDETEGLGCVYVLPLQPFLQRAQAPEELRTTLATTEAIITFWVRQDLAPSALPQELVAALISWLTNSWPLHGWVFRAIREETSSIQALEANALRRLGEITPPYLACTYWLYGLDPPLAT